MHEKPFKTAPNTATNEPEPHDDEYTTQQKVTAWILEYGELNGVEWRVPIDAGRSGRFAAFSCPCPESDEEKPGEVKPPKPWDGSEPLKPFPYPVPIAKSDLAVFAVRTEWIEDLSSRERLQQHLETLSEWREVVETIRLEIVRQRDLQQIIDGERSLGLPACFVAAVRQLRELNGELKTGEPLSEGDINDINTHLRDRETAAGWVKRLTEFSTPFGLNVERLLESRSLPATPHTQRFAVAEALKAEKMLEESDATYRPSRGLKIVSVCIAPRYQSFARGNRIGDVVTRLASSERWAGDAINDFAKTAAEHRSFWAKQGKSKPSGDLRGGGSEAELDTYKGARALVENAVKEGRYKPRTKERRDVRTEVHRLCEKEAGKRLDERRIKKQADSIADRLQERLSPTRAKKPKKTKM